MNAREESMRTSRPLRDTAGDPGQSWPILADPQVRSPTRLPGAGGDLPIDAPATSARCPNGTPRDVRVETQRGRSLRRRCAFRRRIGASASVNSPAAKSARVPGSGTELPEPPVSIDTYGMRLPPPSRL